MLHWIQEYQIAARSQQGTAGRDHVNSADCWMLYFLESDGQTFYSLLSHAAPSHPSVQPSQQRISLCTFSLAPHILQAIWLRFTTKTFTANCSFLPPSLFFIFSSPLPFLLPPHSDLFYGISLCFVCFTVTAFISPSVWPHIISKVDPNASPGRCKHALPVSLRNKSNIWKKTNKYKCKYPLGDGLRNFCV